MSEWFARFFGAKPHLFGGPILGKGAITTCTAVAVTGVTSVLAFNGNRRAAIFVNTHATATLYLGPATIAIGQGIVLAPGASFDDTDTTAQWFAVPSTGTVSCAVTELS